MRILALYASKNTPGHGNDAGGAFIPQAQVFAKMRRAAGDEVEIVPFDNLIANRKARVEAFRDLIGMNGLFDALVYFGHGLRNGLPSAGERVEDVAWLAQRIHASACARLIVTLYACSTAGAPGADRDKLEGDNGFADRLRDELSKLGHVGWIDAHTIPGHTTINRYTRRFYMDGKGEAVGGRFIVAPGSPEWGAWGDALKDDQGFRMGFPFMTEAEIYARLARAA